MMSLRDAAKAKLLEEIDEIVASHNGAITRDKAFEIWVAENLLGLDPQDAIEATEVAGTGDCGCDVYHYNDPDRILSFGQVKWADNLDHPIDRDEINEYFLETIDHLENCPGDANTTFQRHSVEFNDVKDVSRIRIYLIVTGELTAGGRQRYEDPTFIQTHKGEDDWILLTLDDVLNSVIIDTTTPLKISFERQPLEKIDNNTNKKTLLGFVHGLEIVRICTDPAYRSSIFLENPRRSLLRTTVNKQILNTLDDNNEKRIFYKLNNGITACCKKITHLNNFEYEIDNFKIVNGRQTIFALTEKPLAVDNTVSLELKIHEIADDAEMRLISKCTNSQNQIKPSDLVHGTDELRILNLKFESYQKPWKFELQRGDWNELTTDQRRTITKRRKLEKEPMARRYLGYNFESSSGIKFNEKEIFEIIPSPGVQNTFQRIFQNKEPLDFIIPHIFYVILVELEKIWKDSAQRVDDTNLLHQKVIKLHILSFIRDSLDSTANKDQIIARLVDVFENLSNTDSLPTEFIEIGESAFDSFLLSWTMYAPQVQIIPYDYTNARKHLIQTSTALQQMLNFKSINQRNLRTDSILVSMNNLLPAPPATP